MNTNQISSFWAILSKLAHQTQKFSLFSIKAKGIELSSYFRVFLWVFEAWLFIFMESLRSHNSLWIYQDWEPLWALKRGISRYRDAIPQPLDSQYFYCIILYGQIVSLQGQGNRQLILLPPETKDKLLHFGKNDAAGIYLLL